MTLWMDPTGTVVHDHDPYIAADGTVYPPQYPKAEICGMVEVAEPPPPEDATLIVPGTWRVERLDGVPTKVWDTVARPPAEVMARARAARLAVVQAACRQAILAGYASSALGAPHAYPNRETDQSNMAASVLASLMPGLPTDWSTPFWCADSDGVWLRRLHSAAQIRQAGVDAKAWVVACQERLNGPDGTGGLIARITAATSVAEIEAVVW
ncbi:MAG: hypothetical protein EPN20_08235 [Magnetospirillum sp.]|nr:MAG: hypothetical protein EPN20_08235 [Magnetospirillum sp.]